MGKKPKDEMLPALTGVQLDLDDKNKPTYCLVGLRTVEGVKSFTLHAEGARLLIQGLQAFVDRVDKDAKG
ncbi:hypothetical protein ACVDG8_001865 [Mesorhizobium sp. ORM8.1]